MAATGAPELPDVATTNAWVAQLNRASEDAGAIGGSGGPAAAVAAKQPHAVVRYITSPVGVSVICVLAVFVVSLVLLVAIQPPFVMTQPESKLEAERFSGGKAAAAAAIAAAVALVIIVIVYIAARYKHKAAAPP